MTREFVFCVVRRSRNLISSVKARKRRNPKTKSREERRHGPTGEHMMFQTFLFLMCLCMLLEFSRGFVVQRLRIQHCHGTAAKNFRVSKQLWALVEEPDKYYQLANTAVTEAGFFAVFVMTLLVYSIVQNTVGMSEMRAERKADKEEMMERMDKAEAERKADKDEMRVQRKADKWEMRVFSVVTVLIAVIALKPDKFLSILPLFRS